MEHIRNWLLPVLLCVGNVVLFHAYTNSLDIQLSTAEFVATDAATMVAAVALGFRRRAPLATLCVVTLMTVLGLIATAPDGFGVALADAVALYSVAVRCRDAIAWRAVAALIAVTTLTSLGLFGLGEDFAFEAGGYLFFYPCIASFGLKRRHRKARQAEEARRLQAIEEHKRTAAAIERRRLARELHDVTAHHLTAIIVSSSAAERLNDRQPELAGDALTFAAGTGREILTALRRLVAVLKTGERDQVAPPAGRIAELARAFNRLGQQVWVDVEPELSGPAAETAFGIVRESLTNTLRYAPGAAVRVVVRRSSDRILVLVENGESTGVPAVGQGTGLGIAGMKERAEAAGGTLTSGPGTDGGWQVRADLPADMPALASTPRHHAVRWRERWVTDVAVALAVVAMPVTDAAATLAEARPAGLPAVTSLAVLLSLLPGLCLLGRRVRPWIALAGVVATSWLLPLAIGLDALPAVYLLPLTFLGAYAAAVYAVTVYGADPRLSWWSVPASAAGFGILAGAFDIVVPVDGEPVDVAFDVFLAVMVALVMAAPLLGCWAVGGAVRRRRDGRLGGDSDALVEMVRATEAAVRIERRRIGTRLQLSVVSRTTRIIALAEAGQLDGVVSEARSALAAMRELLDTLHEDGAPAPRTPHLTEKAH